MWSMCFLKTVSKRVLPNPNTSAIEFVEATSKKLKSRERKDLLNKSQDKFGKKSFK